MPATNAHDPELERLDKTIRPGTGATVPGNEGMDAKADAEQAATEASFERLSRRQDADTKRRVG